MPTGNKSAGWNTLPLLTALGGLFISLAVNLQPLFLDEVIVIPYEREGSVNANLLVASQLASLLFLFYLANARIRTAASRIIWFGFVVAAVGALVAPLGPYVEAIIGGSGLLVYSLARIVLTTGVDTASARLASLGGDVAADRGLNRLPERMALLTVFGATIIGGVLLQTPAQSVGLWFPMLLPALVAAAAALLAATTLPQETTHPSDERLPWRKAWNLITIDPRMQLLFAAAFFVRADLIVMSLFLTLWLISVSDMVGLNQSEAVAHAGMLIASVGMIMLLAMPSWKRYMRRNSRISSIGASLALTGLGFLLTGVIGNPYEPIMLLPLGLIAIGHAGALVATTMLVEELSPHGARGTTQGILVMTGALGVVLLAQSSGYFFDAVGPRSPFVVIGAGCLMVMAYAIWLIRSGLDENADHALATRRPLNLRPLVFLMATLPLIWLVGRVLMSGYVPGNSLGQMPVGFINRYLGDWAINFLIISLALRPVYEKTRVKQVMYYSRMIGLYAFFYAFLHVVTYVWLEWVFQWNAIFMDLYQRPFILIGVIAFVLLGLLALTSSKRIMRQLGGREWKRVHQAVYAVNVLVILHFIFAATHENGEPYIYGIIVGILLAYRLKPKEARRPLADRA